MANSSSRNTVAVIGGSGLYDVEWLENREELSLETPFGKPSGPIIRGSLEEMEVLFLPRHGVGHTILPSEVNYRANIYALKSLGAAWCISISAVGSLKEEHKPGEVLVPDQFIDRTKGRASTFFGEGIAAHVAFASPVCPVIKQVIFDCAQQVAAERGSKAHLNGTYLCMEGPAFSTRAESRMYRSWGASVIGMTNLPEAKLAREAEIAYATLALITDYDCWRSETDDINVDEILQTLANNSSLAVEVIHRVVLSLHGKTPSELASNALAMAIITAPDKISAAARKRLEPIVGRYLRDA